jgi:hypothetical protein
MNNFEKLKSMSAEELAEWFDKYIAFDNAPYMIWFDQKYCKNCEPIMCKYEDSKYEFPCSYCELEGTCKFFPEQENTPDSQKIIKMWLGVEAEDE